ncbi:MAG TPA: electron transfer flavoprotein subunit alpha/FixB family protein [Ktedonobacteraceae bacterium]|nr:electron transfer flavoprotein subunit alpha/FixB family protein [Ktedonobacteraceae bacterium]
MNELWAVLEQDATAVHEQSDELLNEVADIARSQPEPARLCAVLLAAPDSAPPDTDALAASGVQRLYLLEHPALAHYTTAARVDALAWLIGQRAPRLVVTSATRNGRDWAPRLAARLRLPFVSGCLGLALHDDALLALRSLYEGRAYAQTYTPLRERTALATLIPGVRGAPARKQPSKEGTASPEVVRLTPEIAQGRGQERIRRVALQAPSPEEVELEAAERIIAGGRGVGREGFATIATFAHELGAAVGATRVATDLGWIEHARQIGSTGKTVRPRLYIACGISGAAQHTSGMSEAQTIIAINPDRSAPIFALADLGLLGDANQVLPLAAEIIRNAQVRDDGH